MNYSIDNSIVIGFFDAEELTEQDARIFRLEQALLSVVNQLDNAREQLNVPHGQCRPIYAGTFVNTARSIALCALAK